MCENFAKSELEYEKDSSLKRDDVVALEEWVKKQSHLPEMSEMKLILFLHSNYYNVDAAKKAIENYYTTRTLCPEFFANRDPRNEHLELAMKTSLITILPVRTKENYPILLTRLVDLHPEKYDFNEALKVIDMVVSLTLMQIGTTPGQVMIIDGKGFTLNHFFRCNIASIKKYMYFVQEASPIRFKAVHIVNVSSVTEKFSALAKPFIKRNVYDAIHFHKTIGSLEDFIPKEALPTEMGGTGGTCKELQDNISKNLTEHHQYFSQEEKEIADESKRIGAPKNSMELFGIEGSFKKLEFD